MQNPLPKCTIHQRHSAGTTRVAAVKRRRRKIEEEVIKFASQMPCMKMGESIRTFMKMASPDGTLSNMSPPTCSTPVEHLEIGNNEWLKFCSSVKVTNYLMILYKMVKSEDVINIEQYQDRQARLRRHGVDHN